MTRDLEFSLYRLNLVDDPPSLFEGTLIRSNQQIIDVFRKATSPESDTIQDTATAIYKWSVRDVVEYEATQSTQSILGLTLSRSTISSTGVVVTDEGVEAGISESHPPLANSTHLFIYLERHLIAAEHNSSLMRTAAWIREFEAILNDARMGLEFQTRLQCEPVPKSEEILNAFRSFDRLTRLRVHLRLPNPDITPTIKDLYDNLKAGGVREYLQDMRNPSGLNKEEKQLPHASAAMAQAGYKDGEVLMEGRRNGRFEKVSTGRRAARGRVENLKNYVRGMRSTAKSKETVAAVDSILEEIKRLQPGSEQS